MLKTLDKAQIKGRKVLLRVAYDITLANQAGKWIVPDDQRIKATLPTIKYLLEQDCRIILMSWLGRPEPGQIEDKYKMDATADRLSVLLEQEVKKINQTIGPEAASNVSKMKPKDILMLENTRFNKGETEADPELARQMASLADFVVFDAFAQSHRKHASTTGILENHQETCCAGFLMAKELTVLGQILKGTMEPFVVVLGGAKVSDKIAMIRNILDKSAMILIGGALANPFFKTQGFDIGASLVESAQVDQAKGINFDPVEIARELLAQSKNDAVPHELLPEKWPNGGPIKLSKVQLPIDVITAKKTTVGFDDETVKIEKINGRKQLCAEDEAILDIGPYTADIYGEIIKHARTVFWNGPMGLFEDFNFSQGTKKLAEAIAQSKAYSIIGGGDTEAVVTKFDLEGQFGHVSTGGGASLALLAGEKLQVLKWLEV
ncbi:MAG: phosphoglycerate kinase [Candidatus Jacksonbacteria bacterium]